MEKIKKKAREYSRVKSVRYFAALAAFIALFFIFPGSEYETELPHGYKLSRSNAEECVLINAKSEGVAGPSVRSYAVTGDYVTGLVRHNGHIPPDFLGSIKEGYFILDTRSGRIFKGLDKKSWNKRLNRMRIAQPGFQRT